MFDKMRESFKHVTDNRGLTVIKLKRGKTTASNIRRKVSTLKINWMLLGTAVYKRRAMFQELCTQHHNLEMKKQISIQNDNSKRQL
jgi:hypothetical protein